MKISRASLDQPARDGAMMALIIATSAGGQWGDYGGWVANTDNFSTKTGVVFSSDHYTNAGSAHAVLLAGTFSNTLGLRGTAAYDGNTSQAYASVAARVTASGQDVTLDFSGVPTMVDRMRVYASSDASLNGGDGGTVKARGWDGEAWVDLASSTSNISPGQYLDYDFTAAAYTKVQFYAAAVGTALGIGEVRFYGPSSASDVTLADDAVTIDANPTAVSVYVGQQDLEDGADQTVEVSIDNGANFVTAEFQSEFSFLGRSLYRYRANMGGEAGDELIVRYTSNDGLSRRIYEIHYLTEYGA